MSVVWLVVLCSWQVRDAAPQLMSGTAIVEGTVVSDDASRTPLGGVTLRLVRAGVEDIRLTSTDRQGRYQFRELAAGTYTRDDQELSTLTAVGNVIRNLPNTVLIAAAGNDSTDVPFYPAASGWAVGVGSLDRQGGVSNFSNFGPNANVYALGRNHVNAFPDGVYRCRETPDKEDRRVFTPQSGLARWSGTSFAAPLVAGLIAAELSENGGTAKAAARTVLNSVQRRQVRLRPAPLPAYPYGKIKRLHPNF